MLDSIDVMLIVMENKTQNVARFIIGEFKGRGKTYKSLVVIRKCTKALGIKKLCLTKL